jgi:hypothetical protein
MNLFSNKKPQQQLLPLPERIVELRRRVSAAMEDLRVTGNTAASVLADLAQNERLRAALTTPIELTRPKFYSGNIPDKPNALARILGRA